MIATKVFYFLNALRHCLSPNPRLLVPHVSSQEYHRPVLPKFCSMLESLGELLLISDAGHTQHQLKQNVLRWHWEMPRGFQCSAGFGKLCHIPPAAEGFIKANANIGELFLSCPRHPVRMTLVRTWRSSVKCWEGEILITLAISPLHLTLSASHLFFNEMGVIATSRVCSKDWPQIWKTEDTVSDTHQDFNKRLGKSTPF